MDGWMGAESGAGKMPCELTAYRSTPHGINNDRIPFPGPRNSHALSSLTTTSVRLFLSALFTMAPLSFLSAPLLANVVAAVTLSVASSGGNATSGYQYGLMFEDINYSGDGGIYAELIRNRAFQGSSIVPSTLDPWTAVGDASLALDNSSSLSAALPTSVAVTALSDGVVGISNPGWWGSMYSSTMLLPVGASFTMAN